MRLVRIFSRQRALKLERLGWRRLARSLLEDMLDTNHYQLGAHFIAANEMAKLNATFLDHAGSTDVITFNHQEESGDKKPTPLLHKLMEEREQWKCVKLYGEIFISVDDAQIHARRYRVPWQVELARCLVHGVLHLQGFDDLDPVSRRAMKRRENKLLKELSLRFDLSKLARPCP